MSSHPGPIYEVTLRVNSDIVAQFDLWLAEHVREMLAIDGIVDATTFEADEDDEHPVRVTHYYFRSLEDLDHYLAGTAAEMRQSGIDRFGDQFSASRRILTTDHEAGAADSIAQHCLNCGERLSGQYCGSCGQRSRSKLISLWELISDAFGDLFELDSRLWQTLFPLLFRPGRLTRDYLEGKRARFMPPFRMYIVLSLLFFLVLYFNPREDFGILFEPEAAETSEVESTDDDAADSAETETETETETDNTDNEEVDLSDLPIDDIEALVEDGNIESLIEDGDIVVSFSGDDGESGLTINGDDDEGDCDDISSEDMNLPDWLARRMTPERIQATCERLYADEGRRALVDKLKDNVPAALIVLLPLMAFALKTLYPLSKRYYVEHLLFVVHFHSFFFLLLTLQTLFARMGTTAGLIDGVAEAIIFATSLYIPVYLYKSMRRVYVQGHVATSFKFFTLTIAYCVGLVLLLAITTLFAIFSI